jgi:uncharacterized protein (TIGR03437 family)
MRKVVVAQAVVAQAVVASLLVITGCTHETPPLAVGIATPGSGALVKVASGRLAGASIEVPGLALEERKELSIAPGEAKPLPAAAHAVGPAVALLPHGTRFERPVLVSVPFDANGVKPGEALHVYHFEESGERSELAIRSVDRAQGVIKAVTDCFSTVIASSAPVPWWDAWPRFSTNDGVAGVELTTATATIGAGHDEAAGTLYRLQNTLDVQQTVRDLHAKGYRSISWIEGNGQCRQVVCSVHNLGAPDSYEIDPRTGAARTIDSWWTWDHRDTQTGNEVRYFGLASFVNAESWLGPWTLNDPVWGLATPTYPDGTPATGSLSDPANPTLARFHDALASKNLNGGQHVEADYSRAGEAGLVYVTPGNNPPGFSGDISIGKDSAASWWLDYNKKAIRWFAQHDSDGFWMDNASGWDSLGTRPIERGFGEWCVAGFRDFLADHPEVGVANPSGFDVRGYLRSLFKSFFRGRDATNLNDPGWADARFCDDAVWRAYLVYRSKQLSAYFRALHQTVKDEAAASGRFANPDDFFLGGNDVPSLTYGVYTGDEIDAAHFEYNALGGPDIGPVGRGLPPEGHAGPLYAAAVRYGKGRRATAWFYMDGALSGLARNENLSEVLGFEALSQNVTLYNGSSNARMVGTDQSAKVVNDAIARLEPVLGHRARAGAVALLYSTDTQHSRMAPGGFCEGDTPAHTLGYNGWGAALEELQVPYRAIPDFRLSAAELAGVSVLVLPHVRAIEPDTVNNVLVPFLQGGGGLIVTGDDAGSVRQKPGLYASNGSALLRDLDGTPGVVFLSENVGEEFFLDQSRVAGRDAIAQALDQLRSSGRLPVEVDASALGARVRVAVHEDVNAGTAFCDLLNVDLDRASDVLTPSQGGSLVLRVPDMLAGQAISVTFHDADGAVVSPPASFLDDRRIQVTVPAFRVYATLVLAADPQGISFSGNAPAVMAVTNAASYTMGVLAPDSCGAIFGVNLASSTVTVGGNTAQLLYVAPGQINFVVPSGLPAGATVITVRTAGGSVDYPITIANVAPGLFFGAGGAAAASGDSSMLTLYGTGFRHAGSAPTITVAGQSVQVVSWGASSLGVGVDEIVIVPPPGVSSGDAVLTADGQSSNLVTISVP